MTITLTPEELRRFTEQQEEWYYKCLLFVFDHYQEHTYDKSPAEQLKKLQQTYEAKNPRPDWKDML